MRKWIRGRSKRRKKADTAPTSEPASSPAPLQPKFYDDEPPAPVEQFVASSGDVEPEGEPEPVTPPPPSDSQGQGTARPVRKRRRGRGRRGGARAPAAASTPQAEAPPLTPEEPSAEPVARELRPEQSAPTPPAASKGTVVLAIGLPGSGKSSWFKRHNIRPLSTDLLRELLFDDAQEQRFQDLVFSNLRSMLKARLIARRPMNYVDATNLTSHDRQSWIKLAKDYGYDVQGVFFDVPLEVCLERNQRRSRVVSEDVMRRMAAKLKAPTFDEGFSKITVVRVKQKEAG